MVSRFPVVDAQEVVEAILLPCIDSVVGVSKSKMMYSSVHNIVWCYEPSQCTI